MSNNCELAFMISKAEIERMRDAAEERQRFKEEQKRQKEEVVSDMWAEGTSSGSGNSL